MLLTLFIPMSRLDKCKQKLCILSKSLLYIEEKKNNVSELFSKEIIKSVYKFLFLHIPRRTFWSKFVVNQSCILIDFCDQWIRKCKHSCVHIIRRGSVQKILGYRVFIKYCVFSLKLCEFSKLCQFCGSVGVLPAWCV